MIIEELKSCRNKNEGEKREKKVRIRKKNLNSSSDLFAKFAFCSTFFYFHFKFSFPIIALTTSDKKVIGNGKHFVENGNELYIKNASSHLSGYYSCVVQFTSSGAKLETPHELINFVSGE
jgi:hypothetical protein